MLLAYNQVEDDMGRACSTNGGEEKRLLVIGRKARGRETTRKNMMWGGGGVDNIRMDLGEVVWGGVVWTGLFWLRIGTGGELMNAV
jgi:hypothetical protein